ncbi:putative Nudix hydrolase NudL [bioreactor metagenome]|uniref:Putative Nudix hydrolase NudL n=1 Tax=bioreactor metagenome TaxID=1076179 RepID=A0A644TPZ9_9ZZZZ|nr:CoA pyrophosphatase [Negativicutes bacterium]
MTDVCFKKLIAMLAQNKRNVPSSYAFFRAAVLIPLVVNQGNLEMLFEVRSKELSWQPGEICFPGGRIDANDSTPVAAAVRETVEELGVTQNKIRVIGNIDEIISPIGVMLYPTVGLLEDTNFNLNQAEVAEVFTVPLSWLMKNQPLEAVMEMGTKPLEDFPFALLPDYPDEWRARTTYPVLFYKYDDYLIWGLTAYVLNKFVNMLDATDLVS